MEIPYGKQFVALYGNNADSWRTDIVIPILKKYNIPYFDPKNKGWENICEENGDEKQDLIDSLVEREHEALLNCKCVIFYLCKQVKQNKIPVDGWKTYSLASRVEIGFLTGAGIKTFVFVEPDVEGRNYIWAQMKPYSNMVRCNSLEDATIKAINY